MLHWVGKRPLTSVTAFPAQHIETFDPTGSGDIETNKLFHGDNKEVLAYLLANGYRGQVDLIYIDPPFNTGVDYVRKIVLRNMKWQGDKLEGEGYSFAEQIQYSTNWSDDVFLQFLYERLQLLRELLSNVGVIFVRMGIHYCHHVRLLCDELFGKDCFVNEFAVNRIRKNVTKQGKLSIPNAVDSLFVYSKNPDYGYVEIIKHLSVKKEGYWRALDSSEVRPNPTRVIESKKFFPPPGRHFTFEQDKMDLMYKGGKIRINPKNGNPEYWVDEKENITLDTNWTDISGYTFTTGYPTENSEKLLERVIKVASKPGDTVLDCFIGSGTTAAVAQKLGRRWIGCDINKGAIQTTSKRLQNIIFKQIEEQKKESKRPKLIEDLKEIKPASLAFSVCRVNDYDLQIQHNEAVNLACEYIGIERKKTDTFFDGTLGRNLVKIIPFNHPLSPVDLEEIRKELDSRPDEDRAITVVCLGMELASKAWVEEWNRLRKGKNAINRIDVIELRSDAKYGGFIKHEPAKAKINFTRKKDAVAIEIEDFISPAIIQRLQQQAGILKPKIDNWRSMVDCVMIDAGYDGKIFNIKLSDVPEKKNDLVAGKYILEDMKAGVVIAVKIIDMLGEEVLITKTL